MGIILLGHGSRRGQETDLGLQEVVRRLQARLNGKARVRLAGFEFTRPSLEEALLDLAAQGARRALVLPYFLLPGKHTKIEIPQELQRIQRLVPQLIIGYAHTLGPDPRLVGIGIERIQVLLFQVDKLGHKAGVVLVKRGSRPDYDDGENLRGLAEEVEKACQGQVAAVPAQAQFGSPTLEEASRSLVARGCNPVIIAPFLLFPGKVLYDNILPVVDKLRQEHPNVAFPVIPPLGVDDRLIDIALDRVREAGFPV